MFINKSTNLYKKKNNLDKNLKINLIKSHIFMTKDDQSTLYTKLIEL